MRNIEEMNICESHLNFSEILLSSHFYDFSIFTYYPAYFGIHIPGNIDRHVIQSILIHLTEKQGTYILHEERKSFSVWF